jgi:hypothetical protein
MSTKQLQVQIITYLNTTIMANASAIESGVIGIYICALIHHVDLIAGDGIERRAGGVYEMN